MFELFFTINEPGLITFPVFPEKREKLYPEIIDHDAFHARITEEALKMDIFFAEFFKRDKMGELIKLPIKVTYNDIIAYGIQNDVAFKAYTITEESWNSTF